MITWFSMKLLLCLLATTSTHSHLHRASSDLQASRRNNTASSPPSPLANTKEIVVECAIVFRSRCEPGPALRRRLLRWSKSISAQPPKKRCDIWVSTDMSNDTDRFSLKNAAEISGETNRSLKIAEIIEPPQQVIRRQFVNMTTERPDLSNAMWKNLSENKIENWWLHTYTVVNAVKQFPVLVLLHRRCMKTLDWGYCDIWARVFQTEFVLLWLSEASSRGMTYEKIWVLQDDVEFTGDPAAFLHSPKFKDVDFISPHPTVQVPRHHVARHISTFPFVHPLGKNDRDYKNMFFAGEGIRGYSRAFLVALHIETLLGHSAWSEFAAPTLCNHISFCKQAYFAKNEFSTRWEWEDQTDCALTSTELEKKMDPWFQFLSSAWKDVWVHKVTDSKLPKRIFGSCQLVPEVPEAEVPVPESPENQSPNTTPSLSQNVSRFIGLELIGFPSQNEPSLSLPPPRSILSVVPYPRRANVRLSLGQERIRLELFVLFALSSALLGIMLMLLRKRCSFSLKTKRRRHDEHTVLV